MAISRSFIEQLKMSCDIESIISSYVELKREGRNKKCLCPFHLEKTPSMVLYEDTQSFYCFGCGTGGDVITFIMLIENLDYPEAVRFLAARVGMTVPEDGEDDEQAKRKARILEINREAARFFHHCLKTPAGEAGLRYFAQRRLSKQTIVTYGLGYAPNNWDSLRNKLKAKGYSYQEQAEADLVIRSSKGSYYDKFRNRVIFPIIDLRGNVIAFGGRVLDDSKPKYLNSSDTAVFKKSRNLFSLNFAKNFKEKTLILAEGYMDVIAMHQAGFANAVATLGTALTAEQARLISRYANDVVIAYDADEAGQTATNRASVLLEEAGLQPRVLELRDAKDPDEFIRSYGAARFSVLLNQSEDVTKNRLKRLRAKYNLDDPEQKVQYIRSYCEVLTELTDPMERDVYAGSLALECSLNKEVVLDRIGYLRKQRQKKTQTKEWKEIQAGKTSNLDKINPESVKYPKEARAEEGILYYLYQHPDQAEELAQQIEPNEFATSFHRKLYDILLDKIRTNSSLDLAYFNDLLSPDEMGRFSGILSRNRSFNINKESLDDYIQVLVRHNNSLKEEQRASISPEEYELRRQKFKNQGRLG